MICGCGERLEATDDERLVEEDSTHLKWVHPDHLVASLSYEQICQVVADRAYKLEYALVYEGDEPDEEFGLDPSWTPLLGRMQIGAIAAAPVEGSNLHTIFCISTDIPIKRRTPLRVRLLAKLYLKRLLT